MPPEPLEPKLTFPFGHAFGARVTQLAKIRDPVARKIADEFIREGHSAFISDGVTSFGVALHLFHNGHGVHIHTNSLPIALEACMWQKAAGSQIAHVVVPAGSVDDQLCMVYGQSANHFARDSGSELEWTVLSLAAMFGDRGPAGKEHTSIQIKRAAVQKPRRVIWIADYKKLSMEFTRQPLVYVSSRDWAEAAGEGNVWVVTSRHPKVKSDERMLKVKDMGEQELRSKQKTDEDRYRVNRALLAGLLGEHFVEVDPPI